MIMELIKVTKRFTVDRLMQANPTTGPQGVTFLLIILVPCKMTIKERSQSLSRAKFDLNKIKDISYKLSYK